MFDIESQLKTLPEKSGVYIMKDSNEVIIYVGKSKNLKNRITSYFRGFNSHTGKTQALVQNIKEFEYIITDNEVEALILEATLIKKYMPKFNVLLKDDKMYPYIQVTLSDKYPRLIMAREFKKNKDKFYGPFISAYQVKSTIDVLHSIYPIRKCNKNLKKNGGRTCLNFHIGKCAGPCQKYISVDDYMAMINEITKFLDGDKKWLLDKLNRDMLLESEKLEFEKAAIMRDQITAIKGLTERQKMSYNNSKNQDIISFWTESNRTCLMVFQIRDGKIEGREQFNIDGGENEDGGVIISSFMAQYYSMMNEIPSEIIISDDIENKDIYEIWMKNLSGRKITITYPLKGEKKKLTDLVRRNAKEYILKFKAKIANDEDFKLKSQTELYDLLGFSVIAGDKFRIEAFDISNTSGVYSVGSMVVYENGKKKRSDYRRYKIKTIIGADDYGSMQEVLKRRLLRCIEEREIAQSNNVNFQFPSLLLIDGGIGHVNCVLEVVKELNLNIPVAGMVKDDFHRTSDLYYNGEMLGLKEKRNAFKYVYGIQEEVHRFTIEYHKSLRAKEMTQSILEEVEGVGPKKRIALLKAFGSIEEMKNKDIDELSQVNGIDEKLAGKIHDFLKNVQGKKQ